MAGLIWTKFFWKDWSSDPGVRACSYAAKGLWIDMLSIIYQNNGYLLLNGERIEPATLAKLTGGTPSEVETLLAELESKGVFSRDRRGVIYCRRILKSEINRRNGRLAVSDKTLKNLRNQNSLDKPFEAEAKKLERKKDKTADAATTTRYAFEGKIVRLVEKHFDQWKLAFSNLDLTAELIARDAWLASDRAKDSDRKNWFISTSKYLVNRNLEAKIKLAQGKNPRGDWDDPQAGII